MRVRLARLHAPIVMVRTDGETEVSIDAQLPAPRAEELIREHFPDEDTAMIHKLVTEAYMPPWPATFPPGPRAAT